MLTILINIKVGGPFFKTRSTCFSLTSNDQTPPAFPINVK